MLLDNKKNYSKDNHLKHLKYRPDVDGLRAIAVLSVLGYHLFPTQFPSGYIGVDIFFVISGYLITNIILSSLDNGSFSIKDFYIKRIKRIFPALAIVLLMSIIYGWFNLFPSEYALLGKHVAAGSAFIANIALWRDSGYFDPVSELNPLLHLWSLGIEEQFYLIWPIVLILIFNLGKRYVLVALILITIVSFSSNVAMVNNKPIATFFLPFTRMWELLIGAFLAFHVWSESRILYSLGIYLRVQDNITFQKKCLNILSILGLSLLVVAFLLINHSNTPFPGFWALLPTVGAALIIAGGPYAWFNYNILASRILVAVGLISYPLYLVHWPVLSFSRIEFGEPDLLGSIVIACISTFLAWLIYKFIEKPLRNSKRGSIPILLLVIVGVIGIYGVLTYKGWISNDRESEQFNFVRKFEETKPQFLYLKENPLYEAYRIDCDFLNVTTEKAKDSINKSCFTSNAEKSIFIWGDSHAQQLNYGLKKLLPVDISILQVATSGCSPSLNKISRDVYGACNKSNQFAMSIISSVKPDLVILAQQKGHERVDWELIAVTLKQLGVKEVILVGPVPKWHPALYKKIARKMPIPPERVLDDADAVSIKTDNFLKKKFQDNSNVKFVSLHDVLCNHLGCLAFVGVSPLDGIVSIDDGHLTKVGSLYIAENKLAEVILQSIAREEFSTVLSKKNN